MLSWLIDEDTLEIPGKIEEVSEIMLERFLKHEEHAIVLFYDEEKRDVREMRDIFKSLESVDDKLDKVLHNSKMMYVIKVHNQKTPWLQVHFKIFYNIFS